MKYLLVTAPLLATIGTASAKWVWVPPPNSKTECTVNDPTDTPLNVRSAPNGRILAGLPGPTRPFRMVLVRIEDVQSTVGLLVAMVLLS
jgi:hypothetical protein